MTLAAQHRQVVRQLKRQIEKADRTGRLTPQRAKVFLHTTTELILLERLMHDPLSPDKGVSWEQVRARIDLMKHGAGLEIIERGRQ